jgi:predicted DsbA family dithiol-disulfide isomerase
VNEVIVLRISAEIGLDASRLKTDVQQPDILAATEQNVKLAQTLKINGTRA